MHADKASLALLDGDCPLQVIVGIETPHTLTRCGAVDSRT